MKLTKKKNLLIDEQITASFQQQRSHEQSKLNHATKTKSTSSMKRKQVPDKDLEEEAIANAREEIA